MKKRLTLFCFLIISLAGSSQAYTFDWVGKTKLKDIVYPGKKYMLIQHCEPKADSVAANGK